MNRLIVWSLVLIFVPPILAEEKPKDKPKPDKLELAEDKANSETDEPELSLPFHEDFSQVKEGALPKGWTGDDSVVVRRYKKIVSLETGDKGMHDVQSPKMIISGDFQFDLQVLLYPPNSTLEVTLKGKKPDTDLPITFFNRGAQFWEITFNKVTEINVDVRNDRANLIRLEREGDVFRLIINNETAVAKRLPEHGDFERIVFGLSGPSGARIFQVSVKSVSKSPENLKEKRKTGTGKPTGKAD